MRPTGVGTGAKEAFGHDIAKSIIIKEGGTHFDADMVEAFLACEAKFLEIRDRFAEGQRAAA